MTILPSGGDFDIARIHRVLLRGSPTATPAALQYIHAVGVVLRDGAASSPALARAMRLEAAEADALISRMAQDGLVGAPDAAGRRALLDNDLTRAMRGA